MTNRARYIALAVMLATPLSAYLYWWNGRAFCPATMSFTPDSVKIANATGYIDGRSRSADEPGLRDRDAPCCKFDQGGGDTPRMTISSYLFLGTFEYAHVPSFDRLANKRGSQDHLVQLDQCGKVIRWGVD